MNPGVFIPTFFPLFLSIWYSLLSLCPLSLWSPPTPHEREGRQNSLCGTLKLCEKSSPVIPVISRQLSWIWDVLAVSPNQRGGRRYQHNSWPNIKHADLETDADAEPPNEMFIPVLCLCWGKTNKKNTGGKKECRLNQWWLWRLFSGREKKLPVIFNSTELIVIWRYSWARLNGKFSRRCEFCSFWSCCRSRHLDKQEKQTSVWLLAVLFVFVLTLFCSFCKSTF